MGLFSSSSDNILIQEYSKNPINNKELQDYTVKYHEGNFICGDDITVFLHIQSDKVIDYGYDGNLSTVSLASASFLSEFIINTKIQDILGRDYEFIAKKGFEVTNKRKRASALPILAIRNALHQYLGDNKVDDFDDLISE